MKKPKKRRECKHKKENGICELAGRAMKETCFEWRCRSFEPAEQEQQQEQEEKNMGQWKPEYNRSRTHKTTTSTEVKARYNAKAYDRLTLTLPKGSKDLLQKEAERRGVSVNRLLTDTLTHSLPECISLGGGGGAKCH